MQSKYPAKAKNASAVILIWKNVCILLGLLSHGSSIELHPVFLNESSTCEFKHFKRSSNKNSHLFNKFLCSTKAIWLFLNTGCVLSTFSSSIRLSILICAGSSVGYEELSYFKSFNDFLTCNSFSSGSWLKKSKSLCKKFAGFILNEAFVLWLDKLSFLLPFAIGICIKFTATDIKRTKILFILRQISLHTFLSLQRFPPN